MRELTAIVIGLALLAGGRYYLNQQVDTVKHEIAKPAQGPIAVPTSKVDFVPPTDMTLNSAPIQLDARQNEEIEKFNH